MNQRVLDYSGEINPIPTSKAQQDILVDRIKDPKFYLESFCKIKTPHNGGGIQKFILNDVQKDLFNTIRKNSRIMVLKARQLGCCVHPDQRVLTADLKWIKMDDIKVGTRVVAIDENFNGRKGRKMRTAVVEAKWDVFEVAFRIKMDDGRELILTEDHRMLSKKRETATDTTWKKAKYFKIGDSIRSITTPWEDGNYEDGWFAGMIDGEGRERWNGKSLPNEGWRKIVSIERLQRQRMIDLQTSEKTFILEGFASHNSTAVAGYAYHFAITHPGVTVALIGYNSDLTKEFLDKVKTFYLTTPEEIRPIIEYNSKYEMTFPKSKSKIRVFPSTEEVGRGFTLDLVLASELAFWDNASTKMTAIEAAAHKGKIIVESTPNGAHGLYYQMWNADNGYEKKKYGWWWMYTQEEIKLIEKRMNNPRKFAQEYSMEFLASGRTVFDPEMIIRAKKDILKLGDKNDNDWTVQTYDGLRVYREPEAEEPYVMGVDVSEGVEGGDYSVVTIFNRRTGEEVGFWKGFIPPDRLATKLSIWGRYFKNALCVVEVNGHGLTTITGLKNALYPNMYFRPSKFESVGFGSSDKMGWRTTKLTRPLMIDDLAQGLRDQMLVIHSEETLEEMLSFIYDDAGNMVTSEGSHDDCLFSTAVAFQGFKSISGVPLDQVDYSSHLPSSYSY